MYIVLLDRQNKDAFSYLTDPFFFDALREPDVVALGAAEEDGTAAGVLVCRMRDDWADVVWLYADPRFRGRGVGDLLLTHLLAAVIAQPSLSGIFADYEDRPENAVLTRLFTRKCFQIEKEQKAVYEISLADAAQSPLWRKDMDDARVLPLEAADEAQWKAFQIELQENDQPVATALPIDRRNYHPRLSAVYAADGKIRGVLLMQGDERALDLVYAHVLPGSEIALGLMLYKVGRLAMAACPPETRIRFTPVNEAGEKIAEKLFPALQKKPFRRALLETGTIVRRLAAEAAEAAKAGKASS
jgi:GNAT superfamily N-acetyltransferase